MKHEPVTYLEALLEARYSSIALKSSGSATKPRGILLDITCVLLAQFKANLSSVDGVLIRPGAIQLILILYGDSSPTSALVSWMTAALDAAL